MKYSNLNKLLKSSFYKRLKSKGYKNWKYYLISDQNNPYTKFGYSVYEYGDFFQADFSFNIGFIELRKIYEAIHGPLPNDFKYPTHYGISQTRLCDDKIFDNPDFTIVEEGDIENMVDVVMMFMEERGFQMLEDKSTLLDLEHYINIECNIENRNSSISLILAKLFNKEYYHELLYKYGEAVKGWAHEDLIEDFNKTETFLKAHTREELIEIAGLTEELLGNV